jgi:hypothetical protein
VQIQLQAKFQKSTFKIVQRFKRENGYIQSSFQIWKINSIFVSKYFYLYLFWVLFQNK